MDNGVWVKHLNMGTHAQSFYPSCLPKEQKDVQQKGRVDNSFFVCIGDNQQDKSENMSLYPFFLLRQRPIACLPPLTPTNLPFLHSNRKFSLAYAHSEYPRWLTAKCCYVSKFWPIGWKLIILWQVLRTFLKRQLVYPFCPSSICLPSILLHGMQMLPSKTVWTRILLQLWQNDGWKEPSP